MFGKKTMLKNNQLNFKGNNYKMSDSYKTDNLIVAKLEYISSEQTTYGLMVKTTTQQYIFEKLNENGKIKYRELFTGFIADCEEHYFDTSYIVNITYLKEIVPSIEKNITKYDLLLVLNEVNIKNKQKRF